MTGLSARANTVAPDADEAGHRGDALAGRFQPRPLLDMRLQISDIAGRIAPKWRALGADRRKRGGERIAGLGFSRGDLGIAHVLAEGAAAEERQTGALLCLEL